MFRKIKPLDLSLLLLQKKKILVVTDLQSDLDIEEIWASSWNRISSWAMEDTACSKHCF